MLSCWDKPATKATFKITLDEASELMALPKKLVFEEKWTAAHEVVSSQESRIMSAYLLTAVIILFEYVEDHTSNGSKFCPYY